MIPQGVDVFVATQPVDMRFGIERLSGLVREWMGREPRSRALFVFLGKRRHTMKVLTWDGTGFILVYKKLDTGSFDPPLPYHCTERSVKISEGMMEVLFSGLCGVILH